jgi:redox-sensitive bicupin YhaK (pirin superfamily)
MSSRRKFIKGSAILGASVAVPSLLLGQSGMYSSKNNRRVHRILDADSTMVGTLPVMRAFAGNHNDYVSPFVFFDEFGPVDLKPGSTALKVPAHPHAGVIPTTYFLSGSGHHKDSLDYDFQIHKGEYMMFSSGRGAIHMEESGQKLKEEGGRIHGFQIWLNMPSQHKHDAPGTIVYRDKNMPVIVHKDYMAHVVLGELFGFRSTVKTLTPAFYYYLKLNKQCRIDIPTNPEHNAFIYAVSGKLEVEGQNAVKPNQLVLFKRGQSTINLYSEEGAEVFLLGGQPLNEVVYSYGPFVMNTEQQIVECINNYNAGKMGDPDKVNQ